MGVAPISRSLAIILILSSISAHSAQLVWSGAGGDDLWENSANWIGDQVPTVEDDVLIPSSATVTILRGHEARSLVNDGTIRIVGNNLASDIPGGTYLGISSHGMNRGTIILDSTQSVSPSTLSSSGPLTNSPLGIIEARVGAGGHREVQANLINKGMVSCEFGAELLLQGAYEVAGGTLDGRIGLKNGEVRVSDAPTSGPTTVVLWDACRLTTDNLPGVTLWVQGSAQGNHSTGTSILTISSNHINRGVILLESKDDEYPSMIASETSFTNAAEGVIQIRSGTGGWREIAGHFVNMGAVQAETNSRLYLSGIYELNGGTLNGDIGLKSGEVRVSNAPTAAPTTVVLWDACRLTTDNLPGVTLWVQGSAQGNHSTGTSILTISSNHINRGVILLESKDNEYPSMIASETSFTNAAEGVIQVRSGTGGWREIASELHNEGTLDAGANTSIGYLDARHRNLGQVRVSDLAQVSWKGSELLNEDSGSIYGGGGLDVREIRFETRGTIDVESSDRPLMIVGEFEQTAGTTRLNRGLLRLGPSMTVKGGVLAGPGTVQGDLIMGGTLEAGIAGQSMVIDGSYSEISSSSMVFSLGSGNQVSQDSPLQIKGRASFAGRRVWNATWTTPLMPGVRIRLIEFGPGSSRGGVLIGRHAGSGVILDEFWGGQALELVARQSRGAANPILSLQKLSDGAAFGLLEGLIGLQHVVEYTTDLRIWVPLATMDSQDGVLEFSDSSAQDDLFRFYRARSP